MQEIAELKKEYSTAVSDTDQTGTVVHYKL